MMNIVVNHCYSSTWKPTRQTHTFKGENNLQLLSIYLAFLLGFLLSFMQSGSYINGFK